MFDLLTIRPLKILSLTQNLLSTAISLALVIAPFSSSIATELQKASDIELTKKGSLRVLYQGSNVAQSIAQKEQGLIEQFAQENQLSTEWIAVDKDWQLMSALMKGDGDIILGQGDALASGMADQIKFTYSWGTTLQQVVVRTDTTKIKRLEDLFVHQVALKKSSPSWSVLESHLPENPTMDLVAIPETASFEEVMMRVASGQYDVTIVESDYLKEYLPNHPEVNVAFNFSKAEPRSWAVRTDAEVLQNRLEKYLNKNHLSMIVADLRLEDLPKIQERKALRVITYLSPANYFFNNGKMQGFEYGFIKKFAESKKLNVDVVLASSHEEMRELLLRGDGDIIAASLPKNSLHDENIKMTSAYDYSAPVIIGRESENSLVDIRDLEGRRIALAPESPYRILLQKIQKRGISFDIVETDEGVNTEETLYRVSHAMHDLTILGSHQIKAELNRQVGLKPLFTLSQPVAQSWAVRMSDNKLLSAVNDFIKKEYRRDTYNVLYSKYLSRPGNINEETKLLAQMVELSPYDEVVKKNAEKHSFDWRLIVAQMYQESQFDPEAVSYAGAEGLMQIMPATANDLGVQDLSDPVSNITAGVKYMKILRDQFEQELPLEDKTWFTLASYNAGFTRVKNARALADEMGLDSNRWFGNVEKAMLALSKPYTREGEVRRLCDCGQAVTYVQKIRSLFHNYVRLTEDSQIASADTPLQARDI
ncbi:MAG: membrane-bound lytic murein transglycosylase F [Gammaproteobacteria bacterium]|jgi:membrane-bound lytic murein transglycosylase F